ncbi:MAG TPA: hypothetical protein VMN78_12105 [Longimicrobiales bacterium]|nr:hypothetical protein [Longimicrobiales bacterium]
MRGAGLGLALALGLVLAPATLGAQETDTVRLGAPDTVAPAPADSFMLVDSIIEPDDTVTVERDVEDSLAAEPPPRLVPLPLPPPVEPGFAEGVWVWQRAALLRSTALSLGDLLERVPSLTRVRAGYYTQPELVVSPVALSGDIEVLLDGFPLDPLTSTTIDLSRIGLTDLERVRVERRGGRLRIELFSLEHPFPRGGFGTPGDSGSAYTRVEIATGDLDTDGLAGAFMAPRFLFGPFAVAISRLDSDGVLRREPGRSSSAWIRWGLLRPSWGVHAEYRRASVEREEGSAFPGEAMREDIVVRARARPFEFLTAELYGGHSEVDDVFLDSPSTELAITHFGLRTAYDRGPIGTRAALRFRNGDTRLDMAGEIAADVRPVSWAGVAGELRYEDWEGASFSSWVASGRLGPWLGARLFAEVTDGAHGLAWLVRPEGTPGVERALQRAGVDWVLGGWRLGVAAFRAEGDSVAPAALPGIGPSGSGSRVLSLYPGFEVGGVEAMFRVPLGFDPVGLEGSYTRLSAGDDGVHALFQPVEQARAAVVYHDLPLDSDQLEIELRLEGEYRGEMRAPGAEPGSVQTIEPINRLNFDLSIRVLDVHAYVSWQNILNWQDLNDLPGRTMPGQTAYFGVKWEMWN